MAMAVLADWILHRRPARIALIAVLFLLPLLVVISAAIVVMVTASAGRRTALQDCGVAFALVAALTALAGEFSFGIAVGAAVTWLAAIGLGHLRRTGSLTLAVQIAVLAGVIGAVAFMAWSRDPQAYWEQVLTEFTGRAKSMGIEVGPADLIPDAARVMTGMIAALAVASALAALFLGSWWVGARGGPMFGQEFQELRMGRVLGLLAGITGLLFLTSLRPGVDDVLLVLGVGFVLQGLAVVHWHGARRHWPRSWPLALYLPMALVARLAVIEMLLLGLLGLFDNGYSLRRARGNVV
jgi:hypothetical protein